MRRPKFNHRGVGARYGKRHIPGEMNKTEQEYADLLQIRKLAGEVQEWLFESVTMKLAKDCRYTPDFFVILANGGIEFIDVKGGGPIDPKSLVKIKMAADKFCEFTFAIEKKRAKKDGGGFARTEY